MYYYQAIRLIVSPSSAEFVSEILFFKIYQSSIVTGAKIVILCSSQYTQNTKGCFHMNLRPRLICSIS